MTDYILNNSLLCLVKNKQIKIIYRVCTPLTTIFMKYMQEVNGINTVYIILLYLY